MFRKKKFGNLIISDKGFEVHLGEDGRGSLTYREGSKEIEINSETSFVDNKLSIGLWRSSIQNWNPPYQHEEITVEKCKNIIKNIKDALEYVGYEIIEVI